MEFKTSSEAYNAIFTKAFSERGANMGRSDVGTKPTDQRVFNRKIDFVDGAYDKGGAYWGTGPEGNRNNLRVEYTKDLTYVRFYRTGKQY